MKTKAMWIGSTEINLPQGKALIVVISKRKPKKNSLSVDFRIDKWKKRVA